MSDVIVGSVGVQLVPSAEGFAAKSKALLQGLTADVVLKPATEQFRAELEEVTRTRAVTIHVDVDTAAAEAKLDEVARDRKAKIQADSSDLLKTNGAFGTLIGLSGVLGAALVPVAGGLTAVAAGAGIAGVAVSDLQKRQKKIDQLRATAAATTSKKTAAAATAQADFLESTLNRTQKAFLASEAGVGVAFRGLLNQIGPDVFRPLTLGLQTLSAILPRLAPLVSLVSRYFGDLMQSISRKVKGGGLDGFLHYAMSAFPQVMNFLGSLIGLFQNLFTGLAPAGSVILGLLTQVFNLLASMPADVIAPLAAALLGLFGGPLIAGIAGVAIVLANLYSSSKSFRDAVNGIVQVIGTALKPIIADLVNFWNGSLLPAIQQLAPVVAALATAWFLVWSKITAFVLPVILKIASFVLDIAVPAIRTLLSVFLTVVGGIVNGASHAFGWVPLLGGKLKGAASDFNSFADSVNASLDGINGSKTITITFQEVFIRARIGKPTMDLAAGLVGGGVSGGGKPAPKPKQQTFSGGGGYSAPKSGGAGAHPKAKVNTAKKEAKNLLKQLAQGIATGGSQLTSALNGILTNIADFPKKFRDHLRTLAKDALAQVSKIKALKSAMADLAKSIKQAFDPSDLFGGTLGALRGGLAKALINVRQALAGQKALIAAGVSPSFLAALLASGNGKLITQLAADPALAKNFAAQYTQIDTAAAALGASGSQAVYNPQIDATNAELKKQTDALTKLAPAIANAINRTGPRSKR